MEPLALARAAVWNADERRPRAPVRLLAHTVMLIAILFVVASAFGAWLGPDQFAALSGLSIVAVRILVLGVAAVGATLLATRFLDRREWADIGISAGRGWWRDMGVGLALGAGLQTGIFLTSLGTGWTHIVGVGGPSVTIVLLSGAALMAAVGLYEELLFRGYYLVNLAEGLRAVPLVDARRAVLIAGVLTSLAFGAVHGTNPNATAVSSALVAGYGAYLALCYLLTDALALPIGFHAAWNYAQGFVYGFPVSGVDLPTSLLATETNGPSVLTGGPFGPEAGILGLVWVALSVPLVWWWVRRKRGVIATPESAAVPDLRAGAVGGDGDGRTPSTAPEEDAAEQELLE